MFIVSIVFAAVISGAGIIIGILISSEAVLFDGVYSLISVLLSMLSLVVNNIISRPESKKFQFGHALFEPLVVLIKSLVMIIICVYALSGAIITIINGGNDASALSAVFYTFLATIGCLWCWGYICRAKLETPLAEAEKKQWFMDFIISFGLCIGFVVALILEHLQMLSVVRYVDPAIVVIISIYFIYVPSRLTYGALRELLMAAPEPQLNKSVKRIVGQVKCDLEFSDTVIRIAKVGRELNTEITFVLADSHTLVEMERLDMIRSQLHEDLSKLGYSLWLTVAFTSDHRWA
ncbi:cation diffusion facilitator family transporter [Dongshaea marina]|uniref:cation diffusion facilitator family transporter n=1 Tax=Dongshaea marina TaxID=2047966 RepID=UPI00131EFD27|nr:cation transporter [Dongshaea marina]